MTSLTSEEIAEYLEFGHIEESQDEEEEALPTEEQVEALWKQVMYRALSDWHLYKNSKDLRRKKLWRSANHWLLHDDTQEIRSFSTVCYIIGWEPKTLRKKLPNLSDEEVKALITSLRGRR